MSETKQLPAIPTTLPPVIVSKFNITLTSQRFQDIANEEATLIYNEDNVVKIKEFLDKTKKVSKAIEATHKEGKEEALRIGRDWDAAKNSFLAQVTAIADLPQKKYTELCTSIAKKAQEAEAEKIRKENIQKLIESNSVNFAKLIADAKTTAELTRVESLINLEKTRKEKYQEFLGAAVTKFNELNYNLKTQKENVKELEILEKEKNKAIESGDDEKALQLIDEIENKESLIEEQKINIQEAVISLSSNTEIIEPEVVINTVKARRSVWKWEVVNQSELVKKAPQWTTVTPNKEAIDNYLAGKKIEGIAGEEFTTAGVRFYLDKTY